MCDECNLITCSPRCPYYDERVNTSKAAQKREYIISGETIVGKKEL